MRSERDSETVRPIYTTSGESMKEPVEQDEEESEELDEGSVRGPRRVRDIKAPSQEEVERHNLTHLPFRNWYSHCVRGRGREAPHHRSMGGQGDLPEISLDVCFPSREGGSGSLTILVAKE